jgi:uncharacterized 2Fe-2S/4Fe-4S cluster protein (DUF4445 family)
MKYELRFFPGDKSIVVKANALLTDIIKGSGINLNTYCSKMGICGKCFIEILEGLLPPLREKEKFLLAHKNLKDNFRLACQYKVKGDLKIRIPQESIYEDAVVLKTGVSVPIEFDPPVKKFSLELKNLKLSSMDQLSISLVPYFKKKFSIPSDLFTSIKKIPPKQTQVTAAVFGGKEILDISPGNTVEKNYGLAVDLGTTTLVVKLIDLNSGKSIDTKTGMNTQAEFGADIISRINFACHREENLSTLKDSIRTALNQMINSVMEKNGISPDSVYEVVIAGNTMP